MSHTATTDDVRAISYFASLSGADVERLARELVVHRHDTREIIVTEGDPPLGFYLVRSGRARLYRSAQDGREQTMRILMPGDTFGEVPLFDEGTTPATIEALEPTEVVLVPTPVFHRALREHADVAMALLGHFSRRLRFFTELIHQVSLQTVHARLARYLYQLAREEGVAREDGIVVPRELTMQDLASLLGSVREVVSRTLRAMEEDGIVVVRRHELVIRDIAGLQAML